MANLPRRALVELGESNLVYLVELFNLHLQLHINRVGLANCTQMYFKRVTKLEIGHLTCSKNLDENQFSSSGIFCKWKLVSSQSIQITM